MKAKKSLLLLVAFITLVSCKKEEKTSEESATTEVQNQQFVVTLDLIMKKDDNIHLYYTQDKSINFDENQSLWSEIKGSDNVQQVVFKLPEDVLPTDLRLDLGNGKNPEQTEVVFKKFTINYYDKIFSASGSEIFNYFYANKDNTIVDPQTGVLKRVDVNQEAAPFLYPHKTLEEEILKLTR